MTGDDVLEIMELLGRAGTDVWIGGGSGIDAEPGRPFRYPASCFVTGAIEGRLVPCLSAEQQVYFHQGYEFTDRDRHDMAQLRQASRRP